MTKRKLKKLVFELSERVFDLRCEVHQLAMLIPPEPEPPLQSTHDPVEGDDVRALRAGLDEKLEREERDAWEAAALRGPDQIQEFCSPDRIRAENESKFGSLGPNAFEFPS